MRAGVFTRLNPETGEIDGDYLELLFIAKSINSAMKRCGINPFTAKARVCYGNRGEGRRNLEVIDDEFVIVSEFTRSDEKFWGRGRDA